MSHEEKKDLLAAAMGALHNAQIGQLNIIVEKGTKVVYHEMNQSQKNSVTLTHEELGRAVLAVQPYMWGASAYAVLFCELRDHKEYPNNMALFERDIESIGQRQPLDWCCKEGTISDAFRHNPAYVKCVDRWEEIGVKGRALHLLRQFQKELA